MIENITFISSEIMLAIFAMAILMFGVFSENKKIVNNITYLSIILFLVNIYLLFRNDLLSSYIDTGVTLFSGAFIFDKLSYFSKVLISVFAVIIFSISLDNKNYANKGKGCFEFPTLIILSIIGSFIVVSSGGILSFYMGLELMSLASYVLVALNREEEKSSEAGIKYFVLGALASGIILFGMSLIYGFTGEVNFDQIQSSLMSLDYNTSLAVVLGFILIFAGLFFKISAAPMHMWAPDVYEGTAKTTLSFISTVPKIAIIAFAIRVVSNFTEEIYEQFSLIIMFVAIISIIVGSFAALKQENIQRLLAYSSIANMGFILIAISVGTSEAFESVLVYILIYAISLLGVFVVISFMHKDNEETVSIIEFAGLSKSNPLYAFSLAILMFSFAGIPPMAGFFAKFYVLLEAIKAEMYILSSIAIICSVVACFYYLRIVKTMYFDDSVLGSIKVIKTKKTILNKIILTVIIIFSLTAFIYIDKILFSASYAISSIG